MPTTPIRKGTGYGDKQDSLKGKNLEGKDRQRQLLYYVSLIRACNKVPYQLVYIGKKFVLI